MHALRRALRAGILLVGLVCAPFGEAVDGRRQLIDDVGRAQPGGRLVELEQQV